MGGIDILEQIDDIREDYQSKAEGNLLRAEAELGEYSVLKCFRTIGIKQEFLINKINRHSKSLMELIETVEGIFDENSKKIFSNLQTHFFNEIPEEFRKYCKRENDRIYLDLPETNPDKLYVSYKKVFAFAKKYLNNADKYEIKSHSRNLLSILGSYDEEEKKFCDLLIYDKETGVIFSGLKIPETNKDQLFLCQFREFYTPLDYIISEYKKEKDNIDNRLIENGYD